MWRLLLLVITFITNNEALDCYECDSQIHGVSCLDPLDTSEMEPVDCRKVFKLQRITFNNATKDSEAINVRLSEKWQSQAVTTDFECVREEKIFHIDNRRLYRRKCQPRNIKPNYCQSLQEVSIFQGFRLEKCDVCYTDRCNSSPNIKLSLILNLIFFYLFYECTNF